MPLRRALAAVASMAIGSMSTPRAARRPELDRGDRQDPGAAADVEDARVREGAVAVRERLERREAQPRRRVEAGPERHPRVEGQDHVVRRRPGGAATSAG